MIKMRKATARLFFSAVTGAILGGIFIVLGLSLIGAGERSKQNGGTAKEGMVSVKPVLEPVKASATPNVESKQTVTSATETPFFKKGGFGYALPVGYRVAEKIMTLDEKNAPNVPAVLTLTKGSVAQEGQYVGLIEKIQEDRLSTEAPQFLPGQTIAVGVSSNALKEADAKLARGQEKITTASGLNGTRYIKVEGIFPYDVVYLNLPDGRLISVVMNYGSSEPLFDEKSYMTVVNSIRVK